MVEPIVDPYDIEYADVNLQGIKESCLEDKNYLVFYSSSGDLVTAMHLRELPKLIDFLRGALQTWKGEESG